MRFAFLSFIFCFLTYLFPIGAFADEQIGDRIILDGVTFEMESSVLKKAAIPSLQPILGEMQSDPSLRISIESYVDASGEPNKDLRLSRRRSQTIFNWLVAQGVEASRISPVGYGSARPLVEKETKDETVKNARIEIVKTKEGYPVAEFSSTRHQFEPVVDGMEVRHDYVVRNTGTAELLIKEVKTG